MARNSQHQKHTQYRPNFWYSISQVLISAMNKGQLLPMVFGIILLVFAFRIPQDEIIPFIEKILDISENYGKLGWITAGIITFVSFYIVRWQRRIHTTEVKRMASEKKALQEELLKRKLPSSNKS